MKSFADKLNGGVCFSESFKRSLINRMAHHLAQRQIRVYRDQLQIDLEQAEMRARDHTLISKWLTQLNTPNEPRADARTS
jgi:hypothetical protein